MQCTAGRCADEEEAQLVLDTMTPDKYPTRTINLIGQAQKDIAKAAIDHAPCGVQMVLREQPKVRTPDQNSAMWSGPLRDIEQQAYVDGKTYSAQVWHNTFKRLYLPEEFDPELCLDGYKKWDFDRDGERVLVGSTKMLTKKGFHQYLEQVLADGAGMGVMFSASPRDM